MAIFTLTDYKNVSLNKWLYFIVNQRKNFSIQVEYLLLFLIISIYYYILQWVGTQFIRYMSQDSSLKRT